MNSRKKASLILSVIGVFLYLLIGNILFTGVISLIGTIIGAKKIKIGGAVILISIPISIVFTLILNFMLEYIPYYTFQEISFFVLYPIPYPHSVFVIIGGILCLKSFDE